MDKEKLKIHVTVLSKNNALVYIFKWIEYNKKHGVIHKMKQEETKQLRKWLSHLKTMDYIKTSDLPNIELYMDQVTTFMEERLKSSRHHPKDKLLTKTMINNYTKNKLLPPPTKKKYGKEQLLLLIFLYYFKNVLSMNDVQKIFEPLTERFYGKQEEVGLEDIYEEVFQQEKEQVDLLVKDIMRKYRKSKQTFQDERYQKEREFLTTFSFICMLSFDVYMKKMLLEQLLVKEEEEET